MMFFFSRPRPWTLGMTMRKKGVSERCFTTFLEQTILGMSIMASGRISTGLGANRAQLEEDGEDCEDPPHTWIDGRDGRKGKKMLVLYYTLSHGLSSLRRDERDGMGNSRRGDSGQGKRQTLMSPGWSRMSLEDHM